MLLCPPLYSGVCSHSCPLSQWCCLIISSSVVPFSSCPRSFPASGSFPMSIYIRWPKYWSFSFRISPSDEYLGLISFRTDWFDLLVVEGTLKSLLQHHSSKASVLCSTFFIVQLTSIHVCWKNHSIDYADLCQWSNVSAFIMLFRLVITFLPRS